MKISKLILIIILISAFLAESTGVGYALRPVATKVSDKTGSDTLIPHTTKPLDVITAQKGSDGKNIFSAVRKGSSGYERGRYQ